MLATLRHPSFGRLTRNSQNEPFGFISVSSRGGLYTFSPELAGLTDPQLRRNGGRPIARRRPGEQSLPAPVFQRMWSDIEAGTAMCRKRCAYFDLCLGGAPVNKLAELGTFAGSETLHCRLSHQAIADSVLLKLETDLSAAQGDGLETQRRTAAYLSATAKFLPPGRTPRTSGLVP